MPRAAFSQIVNRSMSEVLTRSLATSFCTLLPVIALLLFGGETLKDFAFALMVGIASGAYSSIFIASPVLTHWKEREGTYRNRRARITRELGAVPAYATTAGGAPEDIEPARKRRRTRSGSLIAPEEPGEQISREEFQELVRDLDVDSDRPEPEKATAPVAAQPRTRRQARAARRAGPTEAEVETAASPPEVEAASTPPQVEAASTPPQVEAASTPPQVKATGRPAEADGPGTVPERDPAADLTPEDLVLKDEPRRTEKRRRRAGSGAKRRKHGRSR
jgi:SecD/SecF fusion protein